jgi:hypothetical protein
MPSDVGAHLSRYATAEPPDWPAPAPLGAGLAARLDQQGFAQLGRKNSQASKMVA